MEHVYLIIGMPSSGKSTFIAALGEVLISGDVSSTLTIKALAQSENHMVALHQRWLSFQELERTKNTGDENWLSFHVISDENGIRSTIQLPDLSGELLRDAVVTGFYPKTLYQALNNCDGLLLFTNTISKYDDVLIPEFAELFSDKSKLTGSDETGTENNAEKPFDPLDMPEQPKLIQLLQTITKKNTSSQRRLAVMLSAWDTVDQSRTPDDWFYENRSMLSQYIQFNPKHWDVRIYGVSAQGGTLPDDKSKMQEILISSERVHIVGHGAARHDLTAPIKWLMNDQSD